MLESRLNRLSAYVEWFRRLTLEGRDPYLMTFMFKPLKGAIDPQLQQMMSEIERIYRLHVTRVVRHPNSAAHADKRPIWWGVPDLPVYKHEKQNISDISINDGLHFHVIAFYGPTRFSETLPDHFERRRDLYIPVDSRLMRIHVQPIVGDVDAADDVVSYVFKTLEAGRVPDDSVVLLPRTHGECGGQKHSRRPSHNIG